MLHDAAYGAVETGLPQLTGGQHHPKVAGCLGQRLTDPLIGLSARSMLVLNQAAQMTVRTGQGWRGFAALAGLLIAFGCGSAGSALAQGAVRSSHGDWQIRCDTPPGSRSEQCALVQNVAAEDRPNVALTVIVLKLADGRTRLLRVLAPLGVLLPAQLGLRIDAADIGRAGFVRCLPSGCIAEVVMDDNLINQFSSGQTATFIIFQTPEEGIGVPVSLNGFRDGFQRLP